MKKFASTLWVALLLTAGAHGQGIILWNESVNGPLSEDPAQPTSLSPMAAGVNSIIGSTEVVPTPPNWAGHPNIFAIHIPTGFVVNAIQLQVDKPRVWAWIGYPGFSEQLAFVQNPLSGELLTQWGLGFLGAGTYGMYLENHDQQAFTSVANYRVDFVVHAIPEPLSLWLLLGGFGFLGIRRWRKSR